MLVLDIETVRDPEGVETALKFEPEFTGRTGTKDPAKIAAQIEEKRSKWIGAILEGSALSHWTGRVATAAWLDESGHGDAIASSDEVEILTRLRGLLRASPQLVTFNGASFDLPFLRARMLKWGIPLPSSFVMGFPRYRQDVHFDVRAYLTDWDRQAKGTLDRWCRFVGVEPPEEHTAAQIQDLYDGGQWEDLERICASDVRATRDLYNVCQGKPPVVSDEEAEMAGALEDLEL